MAAMERCGSSKRVLTPQQEALKAASRAAALERKRRKLIVDAAGFMLCCVGELAQLSGEGIRSVGRE